MFHARARRLSWRPTPSSSVRGAVALAGLVLAVVALVPAVASARPAVRVVRYRGVALRVPAGWPVYRLTADARTCVRFDRHAVYVGTPSAMQRCPGHAAGRTEAVLMAPASAREVPLVGAAQVTRGGVVLTATWRSRPGLIRQMLGVRSLAAARAPHASLRAMASGGGAVTSPGSTSSGLPSTTLSGSQPGAVYTGRGFDACSTPSPAQMAAWQSSPYRGIGVYIGGANMACAQPNLSTSWVTRQTEAGWHLVPIYVGLQAPHNSCGCAALSAGNATAQGSAAASDAVAHAQAVGLGAGNPIYFDMEAYDRSSSTTSAVMSFLAAWTSQLHDEGYLSGVYSSSGSGVSDLAARFGTGYEEPDDIWIANWNGATNTADPSVPASAWANHQRLHQYSGDHRETWGGTRLDIDGDYLDGQTAAAGTVSTAVQATPSLSATPMPNGDVDLYPSWRGASDVASWEVLGGSSATALAQVATPVSASHKLPIVMRSAFPVFQVEALDAEGNILGMTTPVTTPPHVALFGARVYVPSSGLASVPVECYPLASCRATVTITAGRSRLVRTAVKTVPAGGGLVRFGVSGAVHRLVRRSGHRGVAENVTVRSGGRVATRRLWLVGYSASGAGPARTYAPSASLRVVNGTAFVGSGGTGSLLAGCSGSAPCHVVVSVSVGGSVVATTTPQFLGSGELGLLSFKLPAAVRSALKTAVGNQLPATVSLGLLPPGAPSDGASAAVSETASAQVALTALQ